MRNVLQEFNACSCRFTPPRRVKAPSALTGAPGAAREGNLSCSSLPLTRKVTIWGNWPLKIQKCDAQCCHVTLQLDRSTSKCTGGVYFVIKHCAGGSELLFVRISVYITVLIYCG